MESEPGEDEPTLFRTGKVSRQKFTAEAPAHRPDLLPGQPLPSGLIDEEVPCTASQFVSVPVSIIKTAWTRCVAHLSLYEGDGVEVLASGSRTVAESVRAKSSRQRRFSRRNPSSVTVEPVCIGAAVPVAPKACGRVGRLRGLSNARRMANHPAPTSNKLVTSGAATGAQDFPTSNGRSRRRTRACGQMLWLRPLKLARRKDGW